MQNCNKWIAILFLSVILILPALTLAGRISAKARLPVSAEAFAENGGADISVSGSEETADTPFKKLQAVLNDFTDALFLRKGLIFLNTKATSFLSGGSYFESTQVLPGKDHWLFYKSENETEGHPIWDYMGINRYTQEELTQTAENLTAARDYFESTYGIPFHIVIVPNKELIYSEEMPDTIVRLNDVSRGEQLDDYLKQNTDLSCLYLRDALLEAKKQRQVYYATDTHWNHIGAFAGLQAILEKIYGESAPLGSASFRVDSTTYAGDLAILAGVEERYSIDTLYTFISNSADPAQYHDDVLLLLGDSFSDYLSSQAQFYFKKVYRVSAKDFHIDMMKEYQPDLIIWESAERYIDIFKDRQIYAQ